MYVEGDFRASDLRYSTRQAGHADAKQTGGPSGSRVRLCKSDGYLIWALDQTSADAIAVDLQASGIPPLH